MNDLNVTSNARLWCICGLLVSFGAASAEEPSLRGITPITVYTHLKGVSNESEVNAALVEQTLARFREIGISTAKPLGHDLETNPFIIYDIRIKASDSVSVYYFDTQLRVPAGNRYNDSRITAMILRATRIGTADGPSIPEKALGFCNESLSAITAKWLKENPAGDAP